MKRKFIFEKIEPVERTINIEINKIGSSLREIRMSAYPVGEGAAVQNETATSQELELASAIVMALNLEISPEEIDPNAPLYGDGLGLDSIDMLEIALVVSRNYGFQLRSDDEDNIRIFSSLRSLNQHIQTQRTK